MKRWDYIELVWYANSTSETVVLQWATIMFDSM